jgi:hypothetical protein
MTTRCGLSGAGTETGPRARLSRCATERVKDLRALVLPLPGRSASYTLIDRLTAGRLVRTDTMLATSESERTTVDMVDLIPLKREATSAPAAWCRTTGGR